MKLSELIQRLQQFEARFESAFGVDVDTDVSNLRITASIIMAEKLPDPFLEAKLARELNLRNGAGGHATNTGERINDWKVTMANIELDRFPPPPKTRETVNYCYYEDDDA
jgi:hypothetical protein